MLLLIHHSLGFLLSMYDCIPASRMGRSARGGEPRLHHFSTCIIIQRSICREEFFWGWPSNRGKRAWNCPSEMFKRLLHWVSGNTSHWRVRLHCRPSSCSHQLHFKIVEPSSEIYCILVCIYVCIYIDVPYSFSDAIHKCRFTGQCAQSCPNWSVNHMRILLTVLSQNKKIKEPF